jgi:HD superfamily phosphohydrolase
VDFSTKEDRLTVQFEEQPKLPQYLESTFEKIGDKYTWVREIASGQNGITHLIQSTSSDQTYCIKTIKPSITDPVERERIRKTLVKELDILKPLSHKALPKIYESDLKADQPYYICTYHPGQTLAQFRRLGKLLRQEEAYFVIYTLIDTFEYLHQQRRMHCDAHADNILISERVFGEGIMIIDFGSGHRGSAPEEKTPDRGHLGFKPIVGQARHQKLVDRQESNHQFQQYDFSALGRALALMGDTFFPEASLEQKEAFIDFCRMLQDERINKNWNYVKQQLEFVIDPHHLARAIEPLFMDQQGSRTTITIPVALDLNLGEAIEEVIDCSEFQRLRGIKQLSFCDWIFPGANHTRFEHSLGVCGVAKKALICLSGDRRFKQKFDPTNVRSAILAALIHDIGHYPFAHVIEHYVASRYSDNRQLKHEVNHLNCTLEILEKDDQLKSAIDRHWGSNVREQCQRILRGDMGALSAILDGTIDCDKIDYLQRDAHHCGVSYGSGFKTDELLSSLLCSDDAQEILINDKYIHSVEGFVTAQDQMLSGVYWHARVRAIFAMFHRYLDVLIGKNPNRLPELVQSLRRCRSDAQALREVMLPLLDGYSGANKDHVRSLIAMHWDTDHKYIYSEFNKFSYFDRNPASIHAPDNIFKTIVVSPESIGHSGPPILWAKVRRLRTCYFDAISQKVPAKNSVSQLDVIVDIPWGKGANRMLSVIDADRTYSPQEITSASHLAPSIFQAPTIFSAPIRVFLSKELYYLVHEERESINSTVMEMYFSRQLYEDEENFA